MKKLLLIILTIFAGNAVKAQIQTDPAHWAYGLKKIASNTYEIHLRCTVDAGWHIYAQQQGSDFIGTRTNIAFVKQVGFVTAGKPAEIGKKDKFVNKEVGITNFEYAGIVDFVQKATIKPGIKTITGKITYQTCTHEKCLPQTSTDFTIPITN